MERPATLAAMADDVYARLGSGAINIRTGAQANGGVARFFARQDREFWQFRPYQPGESTRYIDWRKSAAGANTLVRERQRHDRMRAYIWLDSGPNMQFSGKKGTRTKFDTAVILSLALTCVINDYEGDITFMPQKIPGHHQLGDLAAEIQTLPTTSLVDLAKQRLDHGQIILFSDFWDSLHDLETMLSSYPPGKFILMQIVDRAEVTLPYHGRVRFMIAEDGPDTIIDHVDDIRDLYLTRLADHQEKMNGLARTYHATYHRIVTDEDLADRLRAILWGKHGA